MTKKDAAQNFLKLIVENKVDEAYEQFIALDFIHHNQYFKGDRATLMQAMKDANQINPTKQITTKFALEEGNHVTTISHVRQNSQDPGVIVAHIFRFEGEKVVELWDFGQAIAKESPNENGVF